MARQRFDVLISTSPPRTAHFIASRLARFASVPWVMDFRDPWVMQWRQPGTPPTRVPRLQRWLFHQTCSRASAIVANTPQLLAALTKELGPSPSFRRCIPNGFTAPPLAASPGGRTEFTVGYFGQMPGQRSAGVFLRGLRAWLDEAPQAPDRVRVRFVGKGFDREERRARELDLTEYVVFSPTVPRAVALEEMRQQWVLLLVANGQPLQVPGKALEYLATGRRILALTETRSATATLLDGQAGCTVVAAPDGVTAALRDYWQEFVGGAPAVLDRSELFETATHEKRAAAYARLLKEVVNSSI